jgi:2-polyprenyl-3-methyl-5-hydroxy-6-metoxy-1,4-benzoquinol methylase
MPACKLCKKISSNELLSINEFKVYECKRCELIYVAPISKEKILEYYTTGHFISEAGTEEFNKGGFVICPEWKKKEIHFLLERLEAFTAAWWPATRPEKKKTPYPKGDLLDVGCLWGLFMKEAQKAGWTVKGIEPYEKAADYCRTKEGLDVACGTLDLVIYPDDSFDVITLNDVIEHVPEPFDLLASVNRMLKRNGVLLLNTPNYKGLYPRLSLLYHKLKRVDWNHVTPPFHLYDFSPKSIALALESSGFKLERIDYESTIDTVRSTPFKRLAFKSVMLNIISGLGGFFKMGDRMVVWARKNGSVPAI